MRRALGGGVRLSGRSLDIWSPPQEHVGAVPDLQPPRIAPLRASATQGVAVTTAKGCESA